MKASEPKMPELPDVLKGWLSTTQKEMVYAYARDYAAGIRAEVLGELTQVGRLRVTKEGYVSLGASVPELLAAITAGEGAPVYTLATLENPNE